MLEQVHEKKNVVECLCDSHMQWCEQCVNESHVNELNESNPEEGPEIQIDSKIKNQLKKLHTIQQNEQKLR